MKRTHNLSSSKEIRRQLRSNSTAAEAVLWTALKSRKLDGFQWRRQFSIGDYVLDFYCPRAKLGIELDGAGHFTPYGMESDNIKTEILSEYGIRVLHIENKMLRNMPDRVLEAIRQALNGNGHYIEIGYNPLGSSSHSPYLLRKQGETEKCVGLKDCGAISL